MPTSPTPGGKRPEAVGLRSPMFRVDLMLSTARSSGAWRTVVCASLITAFNSALGSVIEKSELARWPSAESGMELVPVAVVPVVPVPVVVVGVVVVVVLVDEVVELVVVVAV